MKHLITTLACVLALGALNLTFAQDSLNIRRVGQSDQIGSENRDIVLRNDLAFVEGNGSLSLLNISAPADGVNRISSISFSSASQYCMGLSLRGDYAFTADRFMSFNILDFSDLENPRRAIQIPQDNVFGKARDIILQDEYAYLLTSNSYIVIVDANDPYRAYLLDARLRLQAGGLVGEMALYNNHLLACAGDLHIISLENPREPELVGSIDMTPSSANEVVVEGDYAYVGSCNEDDVSRIQIFDLTDLEHPEQVCQIDDLPASDPYHPMDICVVGDFLLVTAGGALGIIDVSDFDNPRVSGWDTPEDGALSVVVRDTLAYVGGYRRLTIYDISGALGVPNIAIREEDLTHDFGDVEINASETWQLTIFNTGGWMLNLEPLQWDHPETFQLQYEPSRWRVDGWFDVGAGVQDSYINGVEFVDDRFYVTGGGNGGMDNFVYIFDRNGRQLDSFPQFQRSTWGMRDLAWDGELLWGADGNTIYGFTAEGELEHSFAGPLDACRSLAWDPGRQLLWVSDLSSDIIGVTRDGEVAATIDRPDVRMYGLAWDEAAERGFNLLILGVYADGELALCDLNPETGQMRVLNFDLPCRLENGRGGGGLALTADWDPPQRHIIGTVDGASDALGVWQLTNYYGGEAIPVQAEFEVSLGVVFHPQAEGIYSSDITIRSDDPDNPEVVVELSGAGVPPNVVEPSHLLPAGFDLSVYPNPFNSSTRIGYGLPHAAHIRLAVYDLSGREVALLREGDCRAGFNESVWDASSAPAGVYLVRLQSDEWTALRKIALVK